MTAVADVPLLEINNLTWDTHGNTRRLSPDPLSLDPGETAVVVADDAIGADAFTDLLLGLEMPLSGRIRVGGQEITMRPPTEREIALVPAGAALLPHLTVERNLALAARGDLPPSYVRSRIMYMARRMDIHGFLRARPHELAHDEQLSVALARALCRQLPVQVLVIEDRTGCGPCHAAVSRALGADPGLAVLVVTDDRTRVASLTSPSRFWEVTDAAGS